VWSAEFRHRFVVPQLTLKHFDTPSLCPTDEYQKLADRITALENWVCGVKDQLL
jgi:hypothetical protein